MDDTGGQSEPSMSESTQSKERVMRTLEPKRQIIPVQEKRTGYQSGTEE
jgi:hypothetical protein